MTNTLALGNRCNACGHERKTRNLRYDPDTFMPYCENPWVCNENHPNSPKNLIKNQKETDLLTYVDATEAHKKHLTGNLNKESMQLIYRIMQKPLTIRIQDPEMAQFLAEFQGKAEKENLSETVRYCIQLVKENAGQFYNDHKEAMVEVHKAQNIEEVIKKVEAESDDKVTETDKWAF